MSVLGFEFKDKEITMVYYICEYILDDAPHIKCKKAYTEK